MLKLGLFGALLSDLGGTVGRRVLARETRPISPFLSGNYAPVTEERTDLNLEVVGKLPPELEGMFLRNGPNPHFAPMNRYHWFDGDGMIHGIQLENGVASYRNRYVHTRGFELEAKAGHALYPSITEAPFTSKAPRGEARMKNTANTAFVQHGGKLMALWEGGNPTVVTAPALETVGEYNFNGALRHGFTAHPKVDPVTGELMTYGYRMEKAPYVSYSVFDAQHRLKHTMDLTVPKPLMMHDFAITERYTIFMDLPEIFNLWRVFTGKSPLVYQPELGARLGVMPRLGSNADVKWFDIDPCYVFHVLASWEEGAEIVLVACRYPRFPEFLEGESMAAVASAFASLYEWRINLATGKVKGTELDDQPSEFPQIHQALMGRKVRYGYTLGRQGSELVKYDLQTGNSQRVPMVGKSSEPLFVPHPNAQQEDDGWVASLAYNAETNKSELCILDASSFDAEPVARVLLPQRVPFGFHAAWISAEQLLARG